MAGRNSIVTVDVVAKLAEAFRLGFNDTDACHYAEIDRSTYYRHLESDGDFATQMASAKNYAKLKCCSVLLSAIEEGNIQVCQWWLERRYKDQFGRQIQVNSVEEKERSRAIFEEIRRKFTITKEIKEPTPGNGRVAVDYNDESNIIQG